MNERLFLNTLYSIVAYLKHGLFFGGGFRLGDFNSQDKRFKLSRYFLKYFCGVR